MVSRYVELHCHSNYSFKEGASSLEELIIRADELKYPSLALTDHDNMSGAMEFSRIANSVGIHPITGVEISLTDASHLTLLAETRQGYANICNLVTASYMGINGSRKNPRLDPVFFQKHAEGVILLTGCSKGKISRLVQAGRFQEAEDQLRCYLEWFGTSNVFIELQQNLVYGDTLRNKSLIRLASKFAIGTVATNNVHYHVPERRRLQDILVSIRHNKTLEASHLYRRPNSNFYLRSSDEMERYFHEAPQAIENTLLIASKCNFNLETNFGYRLPDSNDIPVGDTAQSYLEKICEEAAVRRYGSLLPHIRNRLNDEFRLIKIHDLAGFFLIYYEVIKIAREVMIDIGHGSPEIPLEERSPGRGRGSSVAMLVGYLIGLSHIDPLKYGLNVNRFINEDIENIPDIDIDFPRDIREETIRRVHQKYGWERSALAGAISTYKVKGCIRDIGKVLSIPPGEIMQLRTKLDNLDLKEDFNIITKSDDQFDTPIWNLVLELSIELEGFPKYLSQHPSGMIISDKPLIDMVPVQPAGIDDRYICHWDKDSLKDAGIVKIDFLSLGTLSQMQETLELIEDRTGKFIDLSQIDMDDKNVYELIQSADTIGIFQIESAAQMQTVVRLKPSNLTEMAYEVAAVRPGVGVNHGISEFIKRYRDRIDWDYDHHSERLALERTHGIILYQDQVNELAVSVAGFSYGEADNLRRAFSRKNNKALLDLYWKRFSYGAKANGLSRRVSKKIFDKFSGQYMFPESHAYAFGITAYQMSWLKYHYPLEFYVAIFNQQPMGFYNLETLKEDAKNHGIKVLNPDINGSMSKCTIVGKDLFILGLLNVSGMGVSNVNKILETRHKGGAFKSLEDAINRIQLQNDLVENLIFSGAFDSFIEDRKSALWKTGLLAKQIKTQGTLRFPVDQDMAQLPLMTDWEIMLGEYNTIGIHPKSHLMAYIRKDLSSEVSSSQELDAFKEGSRITLVGLVIRRQHPLAKAVFVTLEDEFGHVPFVIWPDIFDRYRHVIMNPILKIDGLVSRKEGTLNVIAQHIEGFVLNETLPKSKNWN